MSPDFTEISHRAINVNACGRAKRLTRRVWPYHWRDKRMGHFGQLQYPSVNTRSVLFTADDNGHPCDQQSSPGFCNYSSPWWNLTNLNYISSKAIMFSGRYFQIEIARPPKNENLLPQPGISERLTLIFTTDFLTNASLGTISLFLSLS